MGGGKHNHEKRFGCVFCSYRFRKYSQLEEHMNTHTKERPHQCDKCDLSFSSGKSLWEHTQVYHLGKMCTCIVCGMEFTTTSGLSSHKKTHGDAQWWTKRVKEHEEKGILSTFKTDWKAVSNNPEEKAEMAEDKDDERLEEAPTKKIKLTLKQEMKPVGGGNGKVKRKWKCNICGKNFNRADNYSLKRHLRTVHKDFSDVGTTTSEAIGIEELPQPEISIISLPTVTPIGPEPEVINNLAASLPEPPEMKKSKPHPLGVKIMKKGKKIRWGCKICGRVFVRADDYSLKRHLRTVHRAVDISNPVMDFSRNPGDKEKLLVKRSRNGIKNLRIRRIKDDGGKCPICNKVFSRFDNVSRHIKSVHVDKHDREEDEDVEEETVEDVGVLENQPDKTLLCSQSDMYNDANAGEGDGAGEGFPPSEPPTTALDLNIAAKDANKTTEETKNDETVPPPPIPETPMPEIDTFGEDDEKQLAKTHGLGEIYSGSGVCQLQLAKITWPDDFIPPQTFSTVTVSTMEEFKSIMETTTPHLEPLDIQGIIAENLNVFREAGINVSEKRKEFLENELECEKLEKNEPPGQSVNKDERTSKALESPPSVTLEDGVLKRVDSPPVAAINDFDVAESNLGIDCDTTKADEGMMEILRDISMLSKNMKKLKEYFGVEDGDESLLQKHSFVESQISLMEGTFERIEKQSKSYGGKEKEMLDGKIKHLQSGYARLVNLSKALKCELEEVVEKTDYMTVTEEMDVIRKNLNESIKWFQYLSECDDFEKWIVEKKKYLESTEPDAEVAKRNFETFLTDFADSNNQIGRIDGMVKKFDGCDVKMMEAVVARGERVKKGYKELLVLKSSKERTLEGAPRIDLLAEIVEGRTEEVLRRWEELVKKAIFVERVKNLTHWADGLKIQLGCYVASSDVGSATDALKVHSVLGEDIKAKENEIRELRVLGGKIRGSNEWVDVKLEALGKVHEEILNKYGETTDWLNDELAYHLFLMKADDIDSATRNYGQFLRDEVASCNLNEIKGFIKRLDDFENKLVAEDEKLRNISDMAEKLVEAGHFAMGLIGKRRSGVVSGREQVKATAKNWNNELKCHDFNNDVLESLAWVNENIKVAKDESYKDLALVDEKLKKHEAFAGELRANKVQIENITRAGQKLVEVFPKKSRKIKKSISKLNSLWKELEVLSGEKYKKLKQGEAHAGFNKNLDGVIARLDSIKNKVYSDTSVGDRRSCKDAVKKAKILEKELVGLGDKIKQLEILVEDMEKEKHFEWERIRRRVDEARGMMEELDRKNGYYCFLYELEVEMEWIWGKRGLVDSDSVAGDLYQAHRIVEDEVSNREPTVNILLEKGQEHAAQYPAANEKLAQFKQAWEGLKSACTNKSRKLDIMLQAQQFFFDDEELETWMQEKQEFETWMQEKQEQKRLEYFAEADECFKCMDEVFRRCDYGDYYEELTVLKKKFQEVELKMDGVNDRFRALDKVDQKLTNGGVDGEDGEEDGMSVQRTHEELHDKWTTMISLMAYHEQKDQAAGKIHVFNREVAELLARINEKFDSIPDIVVRDVNSFDGMHEAFEKDLLALEAQFKALVDGAARLQKLYPTDAQNIQPELLIERWDNLQYRATLRKKQLQNVDLNIFLMDAKQLEKDCSEQEANLKEIKAEGKGYSGLKRFYEFEKVIEGQEEKLKELESQGGKLVRQGDFERGVVKERIKEVGAAIGRVKYLCKVKRDVFESCPHYVQLIRNVNQKTAWVDEKIKKLKHAESQNSGLNLKQKVKTLEMHQALRAEVSSNKKSVEGIFSTAKEFGSEQVVEELRRRWGMLVGLVQEIGKGLDNVLDFLVFTNQCEETDKWVTEIESLVHSGGTGKDFKHCLEIMKRLDKVDKRIHFLNLDADKLISVTGDCDGVIERTRSNLNSRWENLKGNLEAYRVKLNRALETHNRDAERSEGRIDSQMPQLLDQDVGKNLEGCEGVSRKQDAFEAQFHAHHHATGSSSLSLYLIPIEGYLERKHELQAGGKRAGVRSWKHYYVQMSGQLICFFKDQDEFEVGCKAWSSSPISVYQAKCEVASDYTKRKYVFRVKPADGSEFLFAAQSREMMETWVMKIKCHIGFGPKNQLVMEDGGDGDKQEEQDRKLMPPPPPPPKKHQREPNRRVNLQQPISRESSYANIVGEPNGRSPVKQQLQHSNQRPVSVDRSSTLSRQSQNTPKHLSSSSSGSLSPGLNSSSENEQGLHSSSPNSLAPHHTQQRPDLHDNLPQLSGLP